MKDLKGYAILAAAIAVAFLAAGCTTAPGANNTTALSGPAALIGTWQLATFLGTNGETMRALAGSTPLVTFNRDGSVTGTAGCNHFSANYTATGNQLAFSPAASTLMYCTAPSGVMDQELRVFELLPVTAGFTIAGTTLTLLDRAGRPIMTFERAVSPQNAPLVGTVWRLSGFSDKATARSALAGSGATVSFTSDGRITGTTGCNDLTGPYTINGNRISIGPVQVTARACTDPALAAQERDLLDALQVAATYEVRADQLVMADAPGTRAVRFTRVA